MSKNIFKPISVSRKDVLYLSVIIFLVGLIIVSTKVLLAKSNHNYNLSYLSAYFLTPYDSFEDLVSSNNLDVVDFKIKNRDMSLAVGNSSLSSRRGLTGIESMLENQGMIYVFPEVGQYEFSTKGMKFDLDIVWIDDQNQIVHIEKNLPPSSEIGYKPAVKSKYVLELKSGTTQKLGLSVGEIIEIPTEVTSQS